jgi:guanylate kinase
MTLTMLLWLLKMRYKYYNRKTIFEDPRAKRFWKNKISIPEFSQKLRKRIEIEKDALVLITGPTGSGKSTLVGKMCFENFENLEKPDFPREKMYSDDNFFIDPNEFSKAMITQRESVLWLDEAIEAVFNRSWSSEINKLIVIRKNKNRKLKNIHFIILPSAKQVDKALSSHVNFWIHCPKRDNKNYVVAKVFAATYRGLSSDGLDIPKMIEREEKWQKENPTKTDCPPTIHPQYKGYIKFGKFGKRLQKRYDALVDKHQAYGFLTEKEMGPTTKKEMILKQEEYLDERVRELVDDKVNNKLDFWNDLKEKIKMSDQKLERALNRKLDLYGFTSFRKIVLPGDIKN